MEQDTFSPQLNSQACNHWGDPASLSTMVFESNSSSDPSSTRKGEAYANSEVIKNIAVEEKYCKQVSVADVLCLECKQLLFRPVVLNCGHGRLFT